jgi:hypothetical protein
VIVRERLSGSCRIQGQVLFGDVRSEIPDFVFPAGRVLIENGEAHNADDRPMFEELVEPLSEMQCKVIG